ncbi:protein kinase G-activating protein GlnX [Gordonia sinesedis]
MLTRAGRTIRPSTTAPPIRQVLADRRELVAAARERAQSPLSSVRHFAKTTPGRLVMICIVLALASLTSGWYASSVLERRTQTLQAMIDHTEPLAEASQVLYSSLSIADAAANSAFISGGLESPDLRTRYGDALATASESLVTAAGDAGQPGDNTSPEDRALNADLNTLATTIPVYSGLVETARTNNRLGNPVGSAYLGEASALMQSQILPAAQRLYKSRSMAISDPQSALTVPPWGVYIGLLFVIVGLFATSRYLARRTRRRFNLGVLLALVAVVCGLIWLLVAGLMSVAATDAAKNDGADPLRQLTEARILTQQARSAETLSLLRRGDQNQQERIFSEATDRIGAILADLGKNAVDSSGSLSRPQVNAVTSGLEQWRSSDSQARAAIQVGDFARARTLTVGDTPQSSATSYSNVDSALVDAITTTRNSFRDDINTAQRVLGFTGTGILALTIFATVVLVLGLIPRIREYR